jgi:hypothetical protein
MEAGTGTIFHLCAIFLGISPHFGRI